MAHLGYALRPLRHYNPINRQAGRPLYLPPSQSDPAFLLPLLAAPAPCNGVTRFPRKLTLIGVRAGLGALASCSRTGAGPPAWLGGREEVCGLAREDEHVGGVPRRVGRRTARCERARPAPIKATGRIQGLHRPR